jgi:hypothetical protein
MYHEIMRRFENGDKLPLLHPIEDMEIEDATLTEFIKAKGKVEKSLADLGEPKLGEEE